MRMKSERPLLVNGVPQTEFDTHDQHGKELIAKGLAVEVEVEAIPADVNSTALDNAPGGDDVYSDKSLTVPQLKEALAAKSVVFEAGAKKADLEALLDAAQ